MTTGADIVKAARNYLGEGSGRFARAYGQDPSADWCCVFVWYIYQACNAAALFYGGGKTAWVPNVYYYDRAHLRQVSITEAQPGDVVIFDFNHNGTSDHIGFVTGRKNTAELYTIEGNTTGRSAKGGWASSVVAEKTRDRSEIQAIFRPAYSDPNVITIKRKYRVVDPNGAPMRRGASKRYKTVQTVPYKATIRAKKLYKNKYIWTDYGKTGWVPIKEGDTIYLHIK